MIERKEYKKLFVEVSPAFYKNMLFNAINKKEKIMVAYQEDPSRPFRDSDFLKGDKEFEYINMTGSPWKMCRDLVSLVKNTHYDELIVGGYDRIYSWVAVMVSPKKKNAVIVESTLRETQKKGWRVLLKKIFFRRVNKAYVCGKSHEDLVRFFGFKGKVVDILSVGFIRRVPQPVYEERDKVANFVYVGRLIPVKNLEWLIERFVNHTELTLTVIGTGELEEKLKAMAPENVHFTGAIPNTALPQYYQKADVFVLPSYSETYGLAVEEALNNGTPVLLSHMIGCQDNLVVKNDVGLVFKLNDVADFERQLSRICNANFYNHLRKNVSKMDFEKFEENIVRAFIG